MSQPAHDEARAHGQGFHVTSAALRIQRSFHQPPERVTQEAEGHRRQQRASHRCAQQRTHRSARVRCSAARAERGERRERASRAVQKRLGDVSDARQTLDPWRDFMCLDHSTLQNA